MGIIDGLVKTITAPITIVAAAAEDLVEVIEDGESNSNTERKVKEIVDSYKTDED